MTAVTNLTSDPKSESKLLPSSIAFLAVHISLGDLATHSASDLLISRQIHRYQHQHQHTHIYINISIDTNTKVNITRLDSVTIFHRQSHNIQVSQTYLTEGRGALPNRVNFWKNSKRPSSPPLFLANYNAISFMTDIVAYARRYDGQIV